MLLTATNELLRAITTTTSTLDFATHYADHTTTVFTPGSTQGAINAATTTTIAAAPAASTQRQLKAVTLRNRGDASQVVTVTKEVGGTPYYLTPDIPLAPGEALQWTPDGGWQVLDVGGRLKTRDSRSLAITGYSGEWHKVGTAAEAVGNWYSHSKDTGFPGAWSPGTPGLAGRVTDGTLAPDGGCLVIPAAGAGGALFMVGLKAVASVVQYITVQDVLWVNTGLVVTTTTAQAVNSVAWPARDVEGSTNGLGVRIGILVTTATTNAGATAPTLQYTSSDGVAGRTGTMTFPATAVIGTIVWFNLQAGDRGVRSIQSVTLATSLVAGAISLVATQAIGSIPLTVVNTPFAAPGLEGGAGVRLWPGTCALIVYRATATTATTTEGTYTIEER